MVKRLCFLRYISYRPKKGGNSYKNVCEEHYVGARWHSGRASHSESRGPELDPHKRHRVVSLSKTH